MVESKARAWLEVDLSKIKHNMKEIHQLIPAKTKVMGIVKANAYGHGDVEVAKALRSCGVDFFGVSSIDEAIVLREAGIKEKILILGYTPPQHFHYLQEYDIIQTFLSLEYALKCADYAQTHHFKMRGHVKLDTGMGRLGIICKDHSYRIDEVKAIYQNEYLQVEGIFSHFSVSDSLAEDARAYTTHQIELYEKVLADLRVAGIEPGITHLQNSYGILNYGHLNYDYVRPGLLFLGVTSDDTIPIASQPNFQPIMQLKANVSMVKTMQKDDCVSYGRNYRAKVNDKVATVSIGYADGYPRILSNQHPQVLIHGKRCEIIGNICMDQIMVNVSHLDNVQEGDIVTLFGQDGDETITVDELTRWANTINNDTFCWFSARVPRIYHE